MSATRPQPIITGAPGSAYDYSASPLASLPLSGNTSVPSTGAASISAYLWTLAYKPPGSAASITSPTSATCGLADIDLPGTYLVHLKVTDNLARVSFDKWYPKQDPSTKLIEGPEITAVVEIVMKSQFLELEIPGDHSRDYRGKLNAALVKLDNIGSAVIVADDLSTAEGFFDEVTADEVFTSQITSTGVGDPLTIDSAGGIYVNPNGGSFVVVAAEDANIATTDGDVLVSASGSAKKVTLTTANGDIVIDANGAGGDVTVTAAGGVTSTSAGDTFISTTSGRITLEANGVGKDVIIEADDAIRLTSVGLLTVGSSGAAQTATLQATGAGADVSVTSSSGDVGIKANSGDVTVEGATVQVTAGGVSLTSTGTGTPLTISADGDVQIDPSGGSFVVTADSDANIGTTSGDILLAAAGSAKKVTLTTTNGDVVIDANGTGRDVLVTADDEITLTAAGAATVTTTGAAKAATLSTSGAASDVQITTVNGAIAIAASGTAKTLQMFTADGSVVVQAVGSGATARTLSLRTSGSGANDVLIQPSGTGQVQASTVNGNITLTATGGQVIARTPLTQVTGGALNTNVRRVPVLMDSIATTVATIGTTAETLWFTNLPADTLSVNGSCVRGRVIGRGINTGAALSVKVGATAIAGLTLGATSSIICLEFMITRVGSNSQMAWGQGSDGAGGTASAPSFTNLVATDSSTITISVEGISPLVPGDTVFHMATVELLAMP